MALVIGNAAYQHTGRLTNPKNDAIDVSTALKNHGFQIIEGYDLDKAAFDRKVRDFAAALKGAEVGAFFYAGHGLQVAGQNYLVPIDARAEGAEALDFEMVRVDVVHRAMERQSSTNILFLDACRDNPLARNLARSMGTRSSEIGRGLAVIESGIGTLISFSTQPGNVALDGAGRNSPFAGALVRQLSTSTDDLGSMLIAVRNEVIKETKGKQVPWEHSALTGRLFFRNPPRADLTAAAAPGPRSATEMLMYDAPVSELFLKSDLKRLLELAQKKRLPMPDFNMRKPDDGVPEYVQNFIGVWVTSNQSWPSGRQGMLIVVNAHRDGDVVGYTLRGPPRGLSYVQNPAAHRAFTGKVTGDRLLIDFGLSRWRVRLLANDAEITETFSDGKVATAVYKHFWSLHEAERLAKR